MKKPIQCYSVFDFSNNKNTLNIIFIFLLSLMCFTSCFKEDFDDIETPNWQGDLVIPLVNSHMDLSDLVGDSSDVINVDDLTHLLSLIYTTDLYSVFAHDIIIIPDQQNNTNTNINIPNINLQQGDSIVILLNHPFEIIAGNGKKIDSMYFNGELVLDFNTNINYNVIMHYSIPDLTKNGIAFSDKISVSANSGPIHQNYTLDNYRINPDNSGINNNRINVVCTLVVYGDNSGNPNNSPYSINIEEELNNIEFKKIFGSFGKFLIGFHDKMIIDVFDNSHGGVVHFENPEIRLILKNSFGMPVRFENIALTAHTDALDIPFNLSSNSFDVPAPLIVGQEITYSPPLSISNISNGLSIAPKYLLFQCDGIVNPNEIQNNSCTDTSSFNIGIELELPMFGSINKLTLKDTIDFKLENIKDIETLSFNLTTINAFPLSVTVQVYFVDENQQILDSLISTGEELISSAIIDGPPDYKVISPTEKSIITHLPAHRVENLEKAKKIIITAVLSSTSGSLMKIYSTNYIDLKIGVKAKFDTELK